MPGPLAGIRVVDLTAVLLGPTATQVFGDYGADVIKVESPSGDTTRLIGASRNAGMAALFLHTNRNKRSLVLDLKSEQGGDVIRRLVKTADVLFHNMRPEALERLGLSYDDCAKLNPRIIHCGAFGYDRSGRYAGRPAYDDLIQGAVGLPYLMRRAGGEIRYIPSALIDRMVALAAVNATIAALFHRERTGEGQSLEVPMFETMTQMVLAEHLNGHTFEPPLAPMGYSRLLSPARRPFRTKDGYVCAMAYTDKHWKQFFGFTGRTDLAADPRFATLDSRTAHIDELLAAAEEIYQTRTTAEWVEILDEIDIPVMPLNTLETILDDPHLNDIDFFEMTDHPSQGLIRTMPRATRWSKTPIETRMEAPRLGEHSEELLLELGYSKQDIDAMARKRTTIIPEFKSAAE
ncbi:MAG TPA: CoA transferase [Rhizobiaceae bacterium]|nr:CoA transferase [Rhizobiaceae bacterium]